jgi:hypothetical protein
LTSRKAASVGAARRSVGKSRSKTGAR